MHYDHFDPEFVLCTEHRASGIALLCPTCHQDRTSRRLADDAVRQSRAIAAERWSEPAWRSHFVGDEVCLRIGSNLLRGRKVGLSFGLTPLLDVELPPGSAYEPWRLNGSIVHGAGHVARFEGNQVVACSGNWDVELVGKRLTFRQRRGAVMLQLGLGPDEIRIERLDLVWPSGVRLQIDAEGSIVLENLRHTARRNSAGRIVMRENTFVAGGPGGPSVQLFGFGGGARVEELTFTKNTASMQGGVVDLMTLVGIADLLSVDMLNVDSVVDAAG